MSFDGKRVERIRGLPCRDNIEEFAMLEGRLETKTKNEQKRFKGITFINYKNVTKVAQALLIKQNKQKTYNQMEQSKTEGEITNALQEAAKGSEVATVGNFGY